MRSAKFALPLIACSAILYGSCSHKLAPEGNYQETPVVADGYVDDWKLPLRYTNKDNTIQYAITNDSKNLYICILSKDPATVQRILKAGMSVYLDPTAKKNKDISLSFPTRKAADRYRNRNGAPMSRNESIDNSAASNDSAAGEQAAPAGSMNGGSSAISRRDGLEKLIASSDTYNASGFINMQNGQYGLADAKSPIRVSLGLTNDNGIAYEAVIPFRNISYEPLVTKNDAKNFSVGIVLGAYTGGGGQNNGDRPRGGGGGFRPSIGLGMGGFGGGGVGMGVGTGMRLGGGGGGRGRYGSDGDRGKEEENWQTLQFAKK